MKGLHAQDRSIYRKLFSIADVEKKSFLMKKEAILFFSNTGVPETFLEAIWIMADRDQKDYIAETEFYVALKLIACAQNGTESNDDILSTQVPVPHFKGITLGTQPTMEIASINANEREAYIGVFHSCNPIDGLLNSEQASEIFKKSNLPSERLAEIWALANTRNSGTLNKTEFIIAMHYISRLMKDLAGVLPPTLPPQLYAEASGRFGSSIYRHNTTAVNRSRASSTASLAGYTTPIISHMMTTSVTANANTATENIVLRSEEKDLFLSLPDSELGRIWEIADSRRIGKLDLNDFCIAMHLINMRKRGESIEKYESKTSLQSTPLIQYQTASQTQADLNIRYELENLVIELKQQWAKAKLAAENAAKMLKIEQKQNNELTEVSTLGSSYLSKAQPIYSPNTANALELTRTPSLFSGNSSLISPRSDFATTFDAFTGFKEINAESNNQQQRTQPLSPTQSKAISKYGFDITAFDVLSIEDSNAYQEQKPSVKDDLAALFGSSATAAATIVKNKDNTPTFDSIFLSF
ncbi:hypothetical protein BD408DRAFT_444211 [Parasitella parasitica]|nr:hypothetical protein BD408DRAFT_444211 [Parasitella parasitica]